MPTQMIICIIVAIIIFAAVIIVSVHNRLVNKGRKDALKFIDDNNWEGKLYNKFSDYIKTFNYDDKDTLVNIENNLISSMESIGKEFIDEQIRENKDTLSKYSIKFLSSNYSKKLTSSIINKINIFERVDEILRGRTESFNEEIVKEEEKLDNEYKDDKLYYIKESDVELEQSTEEQPLVDSDENGLEWRGFTVPSKEEEAQLNPQIEEDEPYNEFDESMEVITDDVYIDSKGRLHDKVTGKFVKKKK